MADEISMSLSLSCYKPSIMGNPIGRSVADAKFTMAGDAYSQGAILVLTTGTAIPLGQVSTPHWAWFKNLDATNYLTIRNGPAGSILLQLYPGEEHPVALSSSIVPYAFASSASCLLDFLILSL